MKNDDRETKRKTRKGGDVFVWVRQTNPFPFSLDLDPCLSLTSTHGLQKVRKGTYTPSCTSSCTPPCTPAVAAHVPPSLDQKLSKLAAPSPFELTSTTEGKRRIGENKLLSKTAGTRLGTGGSGSGSSSGSGIGSGAGKRYSPYSLPNKCKDCKSSVTQNGAKYCHS